MNCPNSVQLQVVGMAYVPWQRWGDIYEPCKALARGTLLQPWINLLKEAVDE